jgi:hypothetical protein
MVQIPRSQTDTHFAMIINHMSLLWAPQRTFEVPHGVVYKVKDYTVYIGELVTRRQASANSPGVAVCISGPCASSADVSLEPDDFADLQSDIRELWKHLTTGLDFGKSEVRESMQAAQNCGGDQMKEQEAMVRMWGEALRARG